MNIDSDSLRGPTEQPVSCNIKSVPNRSDTDRERLVPYSC